MSKSTLDLELLLSEHRHLGEVFAKVHATASAADVNPQELLAAVDELRTFILRHFAHEEGQGLFSQIRSQAPQLEHEVAELQRQHETMANTLDTLIAELPVGSSWSMPESRAWAERFGDFQTQFAEHEESENVLLQETYDRDVGSKD